MQKATMTKTAKGELTRLVINLFVFLRDEVSLDEAVVEWKNAYTERHMTKIRALPQWQERIKDMTPEEVAELERELNNVPDLAQNLDEINEQKLWQLVQMICARIPGAIGCLRAKSELADHDRLKVVFHLAKQHLISMIHLTTAIGHTNPNDEEKHTLACTLANQIEEMAVGFPLSSIQPARVNKLLRYLQAITMLVMPGTGHESKASEEAVKALANANDRHKEELNQLRERLRPGAVSVIDPKSRQ
jgi:hypothetical protein